MTDRAREGRVAQQILEDPVFQKAVRMADGDFIHRWRNAETTEERERLHAQQAALSEVQKQLEVLVHRGKGANHPRLG